MDLDRAYQNAGTPAENSDILSIGRTIKRHESPWGEEKVQSPDADPFQLESKAWANRDCTAREQEYYREIQDPRMTIGYFVETKFVPEHVLYKTGAGQTHYQAILKHILRPESVDRIFLRCNNSKGRLISVPNWPYLDDVRLCDFSANHIRNILSFAYSRNYSWQTLKHIKNVIGAIIAHAREEGCFDFRNPASQVTLGPKPRKPEESLTIRQTKEIVNLLGSPEREMALTTIYTGMSAMEACNLQWKHVNLSDSPRHENGEIIPPKSIAVGAQLNLGGVKEYARSRRRNVPIAPPLFSILSGVRAGNKYSHPNDFVFAASTGEPLAPLKVRGALRPIALSLGLPWLRWQSLRRVRAAARSEAWDDLSGGLDFRTDLAKPFAYFPLEASPKRENLSGLETAGQMACRYHSCAGARFR